MRDDHGDTPDAAPDFVDFVGLWQMVRLVIDHRTGERGRFEAAVHLVPDGVGMTYHERGNLLLRGRPPMAAQRRYLWRPGGAGRIAVLFDDGRPFHDFDPADPAPAAVHACGEDVYQVRYDFARWPSWRATWNVEGPRKSYLLDSLYFLA